MLHSIGVICYHNLMQHDHNFIVQREMTKIQQKFCTAALGVSERDFDLRIIWYVIWVLAVKSRLLFTQTAAIKSYFPNGRTWNKIM
jgi:hypothetical protein